MISNEQKKKKDITAVNRLQYSAGTVCKGFWFQEFKKYCRRPPVVQKPLEIDDNYYFWRSV